MKLHVTYKERIIVDGKPENPVLELDNVQYIIVDSFTCTGIRGKSMLVIVDNAKKGNEHPNITIPMKDILAFCVD